MAQAHEQIHIHSRVHATDHDQEWRVKLSQEWDVLGPFPIHAREQQFLSPSYPINLSQAIDFRRVWPSSYADNATVGWSKAQLSEDGVITVAFPAVRWESLRATEGWAALQHHAVLRGSMILIPPDKTTSNAAPRVLVQLKQGSYFTILPVNGREENTFTPEWYAGNIYDMERALPRVINLPTVPDPTKPTQYDMFISGDYEIRLFGDPHHLNASIPTQVIGLSVQIDNVKTILHHEPSQDVLCDFVDGFVFGEAIGIGFRSTDWSTVTVVKSNNPLMRNVTVQELELRLKQSTRIAPSQLRVVPLIVFQHRPFYSSSLEMVATAITESGDELQIHLTLPITQRNTASVYEHVALMATYLFGTSMPTAFTAIPPVNKPQNSNPPVLALHGAGVDTIKQTFWAKALPTSNLSWTVIPSGRTSWRAAWINLLTGLDWHGPSVQDAWNCVDALAAILKKSAVWRDTAFKAGTPVVIVGHSNGGQGTWYIGLRYPDRILGMVPAAGYIKSQAYVPLTMSRSAHFIDPSLRAILETSLTPDDNDLFMSNIINKPVLVVHGGDDDNVPVWHGRESFSVVKSWARTLGVASNITMKEDKGQLHFYPTVLNNSQVEDFVNGLLASPERQSHLSEPFTLTVFRPEESGSLNGWKIEEVEVPGRLARLSVTFSASAGTITVRATNVKRFSVSWLPDRISVFSIGGDNIFLDKASQRTPFHFGRDPSSLKWTVCAQLKAQVPSPPTRIQFFLSTSGPINFILSTSGEGNKRNFESLPFRLAHDLYIYHRLDSEIVQDHELVNGSKIDWPEGNIVLVGRMKDPFVQHVLNQGRTPIRLWGNSLMLNGQSLKTDCDTGLVFLHPHPTSPNGLLLLIIAESAVALERAGRLFPIRTGITIPSWVILSSEMDELGAAGLAAAGVWGPEWSWNTVLSWSGYL
ncbi:hypothetical protein AN958_04172 [Leucoagaricus sp. SymC.cos]|nr:hypothetical protein AN958_04172 [Leucoagaricus sp. SymC.cos]